MTRAYEAIRYEAADGVATVTLNRPDVHNAMNEAMRRDLYACFEGLIADDAVRVVVVTGAGAKAFSAGADIREFTAPQVPTQFREHRRRVEFRSLMERCPQPIIAAIGGYAFGGGLELALACDIRIASADSRLGLTEIDLAIIPGGGGTQRLARAIGVARAKDLILTARRIRGEEAAALGLVSRAVPPERLREEALAWARQVARNAPVSLRQAKRAIDGGFALPLDEALELEQRMYQDCLGTRDRVEALQAFAEKRQPVFTGE
jgi:enoyl-CoA hydratase/carnithine racemase